ncbi:MAG: hypothetical protein JXR60_07350 [Bacteroidales bacterium]|nr:hypothetical protein [Bacteroidales bacterium]
MKTKVLITLAILSIFYSCKKDEEKETTPNVVSENTIVFNDQTIAYISSLDTSNYTFVFAGSNAQIAQLKQGQIIVDDTSSIAPNGFLRKITSITNNNGITTVQTEQAKLTEAVKSGSIHFNSGQVKKSNIRQIELSKDVQFSQSKFSVFAFDYNKTIEQGNSTINISGHTELDLDFYMDYEWDFDILTLTPYISEFESGININQSASIVTSAQSGISFEEQIPLAKFYLTPWIIQVGIVPVVFIPVIDLYIDANGQISGTFTMGVTESYNGKLGTRYTSENGFSKVDEDNYSSGYTYPSIELEANFETHLKTEFSLLLYGIAGPFANISGCTQMTSHLYPISNNWDLDLYAGSQVQVGLKVDVIGFSEDWADDYCLFKTNLLHLQNEPIGNVVQITSPTENSNYVIGYNIPIDASVTGETPQKIEFYIDNILVFSDTEAPYEYIWATSGATPGLHQIKVIEYIASQQVSLDELNITLSTPSWSEIDLSSLGMSSSTTCTDVMFTDESNGWITVRGTGYGSILNTFDGGLTWQIVNSSIIQMHEITMFDESSGYVLSQNMVQKTTNGGQNISPIEYYDGYNNVGTFAHDQITNIDFTLNNELIAVGEPDANDYYNYFYRVNLDTHSPIGSPYQIPYFDQYQSVKLEATANLVLLYSIYDENNSTSQYYMISTDGGINFTGHQFNNLSTNEILNGAFILDENNLWIVGGNNTNGAVILNSSNGGTTWNKYNESSLPYFSSVHFIDSNEGYACSNKQTSSAQAKVFYTSDGGQTWTPVNEVSTTEAIEKIYFKGNHLGFAVGQGGIVYRFSNN